MVVVQVEESLGLWIVEKWEFPVTYWTSHEIHWLNH